MRKQIFNLAIATLISFNSNAQNGSPNPNANAQWRITGNSASTSDFIGTTNNQSLILKTNNVQRALFDTQGRTIFDGGGEVIIHPGGLNRPILTNPIAAYMLKVGGSGHFDGELNSRQLFVQEYITFMKSLKGPAINVDSIKMDSTRGIYGHTKVFGDLNVKQNLTVEGDALFKNNLTAEKGILFDANNAIEYIPLTASHGPIYRMGARNGPPVTSRYLCPTPNSNTQPQLLNQGAYISWVPLGSGTGQTNSSLSLYSAPWDGNGVIEVEGLDKDGGKKNSLLINYFCGRNTLINTGWDLDPSHSVYGGRVIMGAEVEMQRSLKIGWNGDPSVIDANTSIEINQNKQNANAVKVLTYNNSVKAFAIETNTGSNNFVVYGNGKTVIGQQKLNIGPHTDGMLTVDGKIVGKSCYVTQLNWADFVFSKDYKLPKLSEIEKYYTKYGHLPLIPSEKEVKENGLDLGEMNKLLLQKIEELTILMVEQDKRIKELENKK